MLFFLVVGEGLLLNFVEAIEEIIGHGAGDVNRTVNGLRRMTDEIENTFTAPDFGAARERLKQGRELWAWSRR